MPATKNRQTGHAESQQKGGRGLGDDRQHTIHLAEGVETSRIGPDITRPGESRAFHGDGRKIAGFRAEVEEIVSRVGERESASMVRSPLMVKAPATLMESKEIGLARPISGTRPLGNLKD